HDALPISRASPSQRASGLRRAQQSEKICLSGSRIDWSSRIVIHFNMGSNKVNGLFDSLGIDEESLNARISFVFGDDPLGNDRGLLEIAPYAYVIKNEKIAIWICRIA